MGYYLKPCETSPNAMSVLHYRFLLFSSCCRQEMRTARAAGLGRESLPLLHPAFDPSSPEVLQGCAVPIFEEAGHLSNIDLTIKTLTSQEVTKIFATEFCQIQVVALGKQSELA